MKKLIKIVASLVLGFASFFLPFSSANVLAAVGENITATITITNGLDHIEPRTIQLDDHSTIDSGGTTSFISTGGQHTISFGISFESELMGYAFTAATVNGVDTPISGPVEGRYSVVVSEAESYTISLTTVRSGDTSHTIIWANPDVKDEITDDDMLIKNGYAKVIAVYDVDGHALKESEWSINPDSKGGLVDGFGHIKIAAGMKVVFEFTPVYGYQLVSVKANEQALTPQETINQYTFTMPDDNVHFAADFAKTDNSVMLESEKVSGGAISLGAGALEAGTARISVSDVSLSEAKASEFDAAADGLTISNVFDIDLFNIFYKGKADSSDVWSNQIHELDGEATITLKLGDDVDVSRVAIVHNINDGDEYEIIKIDSYDTEAHTITFRTSSFSNFAIATGVGSPDTGYVSSKASGSATTSALAFMAAGTFVSVSIYALLRRRG